MPQYCPYTEKLECSPSDRTDEFYRNMQESMLRNKPVYFLVGGMCPVSRYECIKLREFCEKQQTQKQHVR